MAETTTAEQRGDLSFWSPWVIFFLGSPFAALNWWRMRKRGKAIFFLFFNLLIVLLTSWTQYRGGITPTDHAIADKLIFARLLIGIAFSGILAIIMFFDIQRFKKDGKTSESVKWQAVIIFWLILVVASTGTWVSLDYGAREMGQCRFPRLQDVIYQKEFEQRTGLATLVLGRKDFSCDWTWDIEIAEPIAPNGYHLLLVNETDNMDDPRFYVSERIFQYEEVTPDEFSKIVQDTTRSNYPEYSVMTKDPNAKYSNIHCTRSDKYTSCNFIFGYQKIISKFDLDFSGLSDKQINELLQLVVSTNSQRIHAYEEK